MKFPKCIIYVLLALLIILNIILRLPITPHEIGWDSFTIHALGNSISQFGYAKWWLHPASIGGFYPYSYASVVPFLLSGISQCTGIDMEWTIWLFCVLVGIFSAFTAYLMAGAIKDDDLFKFLVAFGFSVSEGVLYFTTWTVSTRGFFIVLLPLFVYLLLKTHTSIVRYSILTFILAIVLVATHHLVYFIIPIVFSYFIVTIYDKLKSYVRFIKVPNSFVSIGVLAGFMFMFLVPFFTGYFIRGTRYIVDEVLITYTRYIGFLIIFVIGGLAYLVFKHDKSFEEWFLLFTLLCLTPMLYDLIYTHWVILVFAFLLIGLGLTNVARMYNRKRKIVFTVIVISLVLSVSMTGYYQAWHTNIKQKDVPVYWTRYPSEATYESALWAKENIDRNIVGYEPLTAIRILAISGVPTLSGARSCDLTYGFVNPADLNITRMSLSIERYTSEPYVTSKTSPNTQYYIEHLPIEDVNSRWTQNLFSKLRIAYIIENRDAYGGIFIQSVRGNKDSVYNNGKICIWLS